ncbi:ribosome silencing factor [Terriglobus sp.]|uniref:ribosome silencing factor n=1 Tax=Terriglobus sp. TaxID=1889013 RepID=UPI003B008A36
MPTLETNQLLSIAVDAADSRKAEEIRILQLDPSESALTDYFLICNGTNERQNAAIADEIEGRLKREYGIYPNSVEGRRQGEWILMDYVDFVVHIFMPEKREHYGLERLRKTATRVSMDDLNSEITKALADARRKTPVAEPVEGEEETEGRRGGKTGRKTSSRVSKALAGTVEIASEEAPKKAKAGVKKAAAKTAAKKTPAKRNVTPQPAAKKRSKKTAAKKKTT